MDLGYKPKQPRGDSPDLTPLNMLRETERTLSLGTDRLLPANCAHICLLAKKDEYSIYIL